MQTASRGICGASQWSDEEQANWVKGVFTQGGRILLYNMCRGEIFAYTLFLQRELQAATNGQFYYTDIACKYWLYFEKLAVSMMELRPLQQMRPFFSVINAKAHWTKFKESHIPYHTVWSCIFIACIAYIYNTSFTMTCYKIWSGRNREGAGIAAGEVQMVHLSCWALITKCITKTGIFYCFSSV